MFFEIKRNTAWQIIRLNKSKVKQEFHATYAYTFLRSKGMLEAIVKNKDVGMGV